jgi:DNA repair protein RadA/Sms
MAKAKQIYVCQSCGSQHSKWAGQCGDCQEWNSLVEEVQSMESKLNARQQGYAGENASKPVSLEQIPCHKEIRIDTCMTELNRVLGGGLVDGSVVLLGGDPGIGKSTLLLEALCRLSQKEKVLYVTGEESLQQVSLRANRLKLETGNIQLLADTHVERILEQLKKVAPKVAVIDSIQTLFSHEISSAPGSVSQVRESAAKLVAFAKQNSIALFLVGHVTKDGALAGPRVLEHMVDCVLYFEGGQSNRFRILRAIKNRFGAVNEIGVFAMTDKGLSQVSNPSAIFLAGHQQPKPGSVIISSWEGTRPLLIELQALVDVSHGSNPRRVCVGLDSNRLAMLLAVLHKHCGVASYDQDVYLNVVGGLKVSETAADLAILLAVISSLRNKAIAREVMIFGEVGLSGEVRPVQAGSERINEAEKQGFKIAIIPKANCPKNYSGKMRLIAVTYLHEAVAALAEVLERALVSAG